MQLKPKPLIRMAAAAVLGSLMLLGAALASASEGLAQSAKPEAAPRAAKGEKVCRYRFPTGERRVWVCKKEEPCCAWDAIKYVKCGSTITGCL